MRKHETDYIKHEVKNTVMPDIKGMLGVLGWVLIKIFPKLEKKLIEHIIKIVEFILNWQKLQKDERN